jgi:hypothetical protein
MSKAIVNFVVLIKHRSFPATDKRTVSEPGGTSQKCQQETRLIGALHAPFERNRWSRWLACPRTNETPEVRWTSPVLRTSAEPRYTLEQA